MRTHKQIIVDAGGALAIARRISRHATSDEALRKRITAWLATDSIPGPYWKALSDHGFASLEELAAGAAKRRAPEQSAEAA